MGSRRLKDLDLTKLLQAVSMCKANQLNIMARDTYNPYSSRKILCYFQERTKFLHILDLKDLLVSTESKLTLNFTKVELNIKNKILDTHSSVIDSYGNIYLIGGCDPAKDYQEVKDIFGYDFEKKTLILRGQMNTARSGHSCCIVRENIYIVGGFNGEKTVKSCEKFNTITGTCEYIANLNTNIAYATVVSFDDQYLYKFGGCIDLGKLDDNIERYNIALDRWEIMRLSPSIRKQYRPMCFSAGVQINDKDIYIFGGNYDYLGEKTSQSYIFRIQNDEKGNTQFVNIDKFPLPIAERFDCNNQVIVYDNHLFCLQNLKKPKKEIKKGEFAKRILICDGNSWILVS